jgi:3-methylcrotonyl-CoA carboxylase alpha subunit
VRVYAEDPAQHDLPQAGPLLLYREPMMPGIRIDSGVVEGGEVTVHYDPMVAKLIAWGDTREAARRRAAIALRNYPILGIRTNTAMLLALLEHPRFISGDLDTGFLDAEGDSLRAALGTEIPAAAVAVAQASGNGAAGPTLPSTAAVTPDPWATLTGWRV